MLSRRKFSACALCAAVGFAATEAQAQSTQAGPGFKRTILQKTELPDSKYVTLLVAVDIDPGTVVARHTHPGVESTYVVEGEAETLGQRSAGEDDQGGRRLSGRARDPAQRAQRRQADPIGRHLRGRQGQAARLAGAGMSSRRVRKK